jgi:hypothetical protein
MAQAGGVEFEIPEAPLPNVEDVDYISLSVAVVKLIRNTIRKTAPVRRQILADGRDELNTARETYQQQLDRIRTGELLDDHSGHLFRSQILESMIDDLDKNISVLSDALQDVNRTFGSDDTYDVSGPVFGGLDVMPNRNGIDWFRVTDMPRD